jgi:hypothetical protein
LVAVHVVRFLSVSASFLYRSVLQLKDKSDMFLRNIGFPRNYTELNPRRPCRTVLISTCFTSAEGIFFCKLAIILLFTFADVLFFTFYFICILLRCTLYNILTTAAATEIFLFSTPVHPNFCSLPHSLIRLFIYEYPLPQNFCFNFLKLAK